LSWPDFCDFAGMVKKGQEQVSRMDSPRQGQQRNPEDPKVKHRGGSQSQSRARPQSEGSRG
jgi:hypothetical protein